MLINELNNLSQYKSTALFIVTFFLMIVANNVGALLNCELRYFLETKMIAKHIAGIMLIFVFIVIEQRKKTLGSKFKLTFILYVWFILLMRSRLPFVFMNMFLFTSLFILEEYKSSITDKKEIEKIDNINKSLFVTTIILTLIGFLRFLFETRKLFKGRWSFYHFWLGMNDDGCLRSKTFGRGK
tara:strand:- start:49 stop:600 length:552 start_codon:yes stop_codon:yes gene_type:complete